ncbi:hypothetical protein [Marinospirillum insulare]|uniref:Uncharacterized protein n=1 Tax=Marinospirillum insulare TaxID=217169 RepID=A0ABQ5ZT82_9GAMM|nr:hypothetical protein [Marinospirillum insulare]GLR63369.1 hypothetical protein GCM10007878_08040 [Marinospirillum insulare]
MDISVIASEEELELNLGACRAKLDHTQAKALRDQLTETLLNALQKEPNYWQTLAAKLTELKYLATSLQSLNDEELTQVITASHQPSWLALVRFTNKEQPELAKRLLKTIGKTGLLAFISLEEFTDQLHLEPATPLAEVITALEALKPLVDKFDSQPTSEELSKTSKLSDSFNTKAASFLNLLASLPASNLRLILKKLNSKELGWLISACKMLEITKFLDQLKTILPEKLFIKLESQCPNQLSDSELRKIMTSLNQEFKALKKLLENRKNS